MTARVMAHRRRAAALLAAAVVVTLGACSGDGAAEEALERAVERESGGEADVEVDDGGAVRIDGEHGTVTVDPETGSMVIEDSDGTSTYQGLAGELPDGFPQEVPLVKGTITYGQAMTDPASGPTYSVIIESTEAVPDLFAEVTAAMAGAGFTVEGESTAPGFASGTFLGPAWRVTVALGSSGGSTTATYAVTAAT